jgi:hypothetical protein
MKRSTLKKMWLGLLLGYFVLPFIAFAAAPETEYVPLTTIPGAFDAGKTVDPVHIIKNIYGISIGIGAILAVGMIIWAGIEYVTVESISGHSDAKDRLMGAVWGILLLLASYIILRTINVDLVNINLDLGAPTVGEKAGADGLSNLVGLVLQRATEASVAEQKATALLAEQQAAVAKIRDIDNQIAAQNKRLIGRNIPQAVKDDVALQIAELERQKTGAVAAQDKTDTDIEAEVTANMEKVAQITAEISTKDTERSAKILEVNRLRGTDPVTKALRVTKLKELTDIETQITQLQAARAKIATQTQKLAPPTPYTPMN